jgi:hypothetical protein
MLVQNNFHAQDIPNSRNIYLRKMQGINSSYCRHRFEKLEILNTPILYIYSIMLFAVDNLHYFQTNPSVHDINISITNNYTYLQLDFLVYKSTNYSAIRIFNKLLGTTARVKNDKIDFQSPLRKYRFTHE